MLFPLWYYRDASGEQSTRVLSMGVAKTDSVFVFIRRDTDT